MSDNQEVTPAGPTSRPVHPTPTKAEQRPDAPTSRVLWPIYLIALSAFVAIWGGWVGLGELTGFGPIRLLPGIFDDFVLNSAITLPLGLEAYAAMALRYFLIPPTGIDPFARKFAGWSALGSLVLGASGQIAYHLMVADGLPKAPWQITAAVSCLPVVVLGCGAALIHLIHRGWSAEPTDAPENPTEAKQSVVTVGTLPVGRSETGPWQPPADTIWLEDEYQKLLDAVASGQSPTDMPTGADREPADEYDRGLDSTADNKDLVDDMAVWAADRGRTGGRPPSRDDVIKAYGIGATRARKLRLTCGWPRSVDEDTDQPTGDPTAVGSADR